MLSKENLLKYCRFIWLYLKYLFMKMQDVMVLRSAAALSYTTLLAVVPLLAVVLSVFTAFPSFGHLRLQVQDFLLQYLMPDIIQNIQTYVSGFINAVGKLTTVGIIGIALTAIMLLSTIESSFNFIFRIRRRRKLTRKAALYGFVLIVFPLLIGSALWIKGYILTLKYFSHQTFLSYPQLSTYIIPNLLTFGFLWLAYKIVPYKKVQKRDACCGAIAAFIMMAVIRQGFGTFLELNVTYKTIYGAIATVPILLIWLYLWWVVVLSGAIVTASLGEFKQRLLSQN